MTASKPKSLTFNDLDISPFPPLPRLVRRGRHLHFADTIEPGTAFETSPSDFPGLPRTAEDLLKSFEMVTRFENMCGLELSVIDQANSRFTSGINRSLGISFPRCFIDSLQSQAVSIVHGTEPGTWLYGVQVPGTSLLAGGCLLASASDIPHAFQRATQRFGIDMTQIQVWAKRHSAIHVENLLRLLKNVHASILQETVESTSRADTESTVQQLGLLQDITVAVMDLTQRMGNDESPLCFADRVSQRLKEICETEMSAVCLIQQQETTYLLDGPWVRDGEDVEEVIMDLLQGRQPEVIVCNHRRSERLRCLFPEIHAIVAVPISNPGNHYGWLILANPLSKEEFGTEDANLLKYFAAMLSSKCQLIQLQSDQQERLLEFVHSLVSTMDAKDPYTRRHSERVALVAQRLALEMGLNPQDTQSIYDSGMLHDIGKIGVKDFVLQKPGKLSDEEFLHMAKHPEIGYEILRELKHLQHVLPGVLHHHEKYDGTGYPSLMSGRQIPLMARILAVADSFDAMSSDRPYRQGMNREVVEKILSEGAGSQWDPDVIKAFHRAKQDIYQLWKCSQADQQVERPSIRLASMDE